MAIVKRKISELPEASALDGTELVEVVQNGQNRRATTGQFGGGGGGGIPEAPADNKTYGRKNEAWVEIEEGEVAIEPVKIVSATDYTLLLADVGKYLLFTNVGANVLTIPANADVALPVGTDIALEQNNTGVVTISPAAGVTINVSNGFNLKTGGQYAVASLKQIATDTWTAFGNLEVQE